jgi:hypothetical protein
MGSTKASDPSFRLGSLPPGLLYDDESVLASSNPFSNPSAAGGEHAARRSKADIASGMADGRSRMILRMP